MRLSRRVYYSLLAEDPKYLNIGNIMLEVEGVCVNIEDLPDSYIQEVFGMTKEELANFIYNKMEINF